MKITCEHVRHVYRQGKDEEVVAVKDCSLEVSAGEVSVLLGVSGSGKSTLLRLLGLQEKPTSGRILLDGKDIASWSERERTRMRREEIGFVHQNYRLIPMLSVEENILLPRHIAGRRYRQEEIIQLAALLGIERKLHEFPAALSGGQQQRVAIARAMVNRPRLLLCDEPTGNLDARTRDGVVEAMMQVHAEYRPTVVIVTHDRELTKVADCVFVMET